MGLCFILAPAGLLKSVATYDVFTSILLDGKSPCQNRFSKKRRLGRRKLLDLRVEAYQLQLESNCRYTELANGEATIIMNSLV